MTAKIATATEVRRSNHNCIRFFGGRKDCGRLETAAADLFHPFCFDRRCRGVKQDRKLINGQ